MAKRALLLLVQVEGLVPDERGQHVEHGDIEKRPPPRAVPIPEGGDDGERGEDGGDLISRGEAGLGRGPVGKPGLGQHPGPGLDDEVHGLGIAIRTLLAVAADGTPDETGVGIDQRSVADSQPLQHAGPEVLHHHVGPLGEPGEEGEPLLHPQVDDHRTLAPTPLDVSEGDVPRPAPAPVQAVDAHVGGNAPADVPTGLFDADHGGAERGQVEGTGRGGNHPSQIEDERAAEGAGAVRRGQRWPSRRERYLRFDGCIAA